MEWKGTDCINPVSTPSSAYLAPLFNQNIINSFKQISSTICGYVVYGENNNSYTDGLAIYKNRTSKITNPYLSMPGYDTIFTMSVFGKPECKLLTINGKIN